MEKIVVHPGERRGRDRSSRDRSASGSCERFSSDNGVRLHLATGAAPAHHLAGPDRVVSDEQFVTATVQLRSDGQQRGPGWKTSRCRPTGARARSHPTRRHPPPAEPRDMPPRPVARTDAPVLLSCTCARSRCARARGHAGASFRSHPRVREDDGRCGGAKPAG